MMSFSLNFSDKPKWIGSVRAKHSCSIWFLFSHEVFPQSDLRSICGPKISSQVQHALQMYLRHRQPEGRAELESNG